MGKVWCVSLFVFLLPIVVGASSVSTTELSPLANSFLSDLHTQSRTYFGRASGNLFQVKSCLEDEVACSEIVIADALTDEQFSIPGTQADVLAYLQDVYKIYRRYVGYKNDFQIRAHSEIGVSVKPFFGAQVVDFYPSSDFGKSEIQDILDQGNEYLVHSEKLLMFVPESERRTAKRSMYSERTQFFDKMIAEIVERFPFVMRMGMAEPSKDSFVRALDKTMKGFIKTETYLAALKPQQRLELLGFLPVLEHTLKMWPKAKADLVMEELVSYSDGQGLVKKLLGIVSNPQTLAITGCYTASFAHVALRWVGLLCGGYGFAKSLPGIYESARGMQRMSSYMSTGQFDDQVYSAQVMHFFASSVMSTVYFRNSIPGLVDQTKHFKARFRRGIRSVKRLKKIRLDRHFSKEVKDMLKSYRDFYGKDVALTEAADLGSGAGRALLDVHRAFRGVASRSAQKAVQTITFTDILRASPMLADGR